ncbi:MAG TPA: hypothetical protein VKV74_00285 [Bryobacteraceae bacterium]|nr:hypothetical protein [Bryobacteraceae bacterium]
MFPRFLLPETVSREDGSGAVIALDQNPGPALLTLGIDRVIEQESLDVSVWGSPDGATWRPLASFPQKSYCGDYFMELNLARHPDIRFLRAQWRMGCWADGPARPLFGFHLKLDKPKSRYAGAA